MAMKHKKMMIVALIVLLLGMMIAMQGCEDNKTTNKIISAVPKDNQTPQQQAAPDQAEQTDDQSDDSNNASLGNQSNETEPKEATGTLTTDLGKLNTFGKNMAFIVGSKAPASDIMTIINLKSALANKGLNTGSALLSTEVSDYKAKNYFVFGSPCDNPVAAELFAEDIKDKGTCQIFGTGEGIIRLLPTKDSNFAMYIGGNAPESTKKAAKVVEKFDVYRLRGTYVVVTGTIDTPQVDVIE